MRGCILKRQRKSGTYYYVVVSTGARRKWIAAGTRRIDAEKVLAEKLRKFQTGSYRDLKKISFTDFSKIWLETYAEGRVRSTTLLRYKQLLEFHLLPYFGPYPLTNIEAEDVQKYLSQKLKEGTISPTTINRTRTVLCEMMKHAILWGYADRNTVQAVQPLKTVKEEMGFLTKEEIERFLNVLPKEHYPLFLFLVLTGARLGEAIGAQWSCLDLSKGQYLIRKSMSRGKFSEPKSATSKRAIDLPPVLIDSLKAHKVEQNKHRLQMGPGWHDLDLIFAGQNGKPLIPENLTRRIFKPALRKAGICEIRIHDLRHTNAALRVQAGEHPKRMQRQLGHASIKVTLDTYGHMMEEVNPQAAERLQQVIFSPASRLVNNQATSATNEEQNSRTVITL